MSVFGYISNIDRPWVDLGDGVYSPWGTGFDGALSRLADSAGYALDVERAATSPFGLGGFGFSPASFGFGASHLYPNPGSYAPQGVGRFASTPDWYFRASDNAMREASQPSAGFTVADRPAAAPPKGFGGITISATGPKRGEKGEEAKKADEPKESKAPVAATEDKLLQGLIAKGYPEHEAKPLIAKLKDNKLLESSALNTIPSKVPQGNEDAATAQARWHSQFGEWYAAEVLKLGGDELPEFLARYATTVEEHKAATLEGKGVASDSGGVVYDVYTVKSGDVSLPRGSTSLFHNPRTGEWKSGKFDAATASASGLKSFSTKYFDAGSNEVVVAVKRRKNFVDDPAGYISALDGKVSEFRETITTRKAAERRNDDARSTFIAGQLAKVGTAATPIVTYDAAKREIRYVVDTAAKTAIIARVGTNPIPSAAKQKYTMLLGSVPDGVKVLFNGREVASGDRDFEKIFSLIQNVP